MDEYFSPYIVVAFIAAFAIIWRTTQSSKLPYPPGPKGVPFLGNIYDIPSTCEWVTYARWSREYDSDVVHLNLAGTHLMIVNTAEAVSELFEHRSAIYSDRPRLPMLVELMGWDWSFALYQYGQKWRFARRLFHDHFNNHALPDFEPRHKKVAYELLHHLVQTPDDFMEHIRLMAGSLILLITYGIEVRSLDDPFLVRVEKTMDTLAVAGNPGAFLVDTLPILKYVPGWFPGAGFQRKAKEWKKMVQATADVPLQFVKDEMAKGTHFPSTTAKSLETLDWKKDKDIAEAIRSVGASTFVAGAETTSTTLTSFILAMVLYPDVCKKCQEELDMIVGPSRLPDFSDKPMLPYICAVMQEVLRWNPVTPMAVAHRLTSDDVYQGHFLPAGSLVLGNAWSILHDEKMYPHPKTFNPDRFLKDGKINPEVRSPEFAAFGFGRRTCAGKDFALQSLFINIACILSTFHIGKAVDQDGNEITPSGEYISGLICRPASFKCSLEPRSTQSLELIINAIKLLNT